MDPDTGVLFWVLELRTPHPLSWWEVTLYHVFFFFSLIGINQAGGSQECMHFAMLTHQECVVSQHTHSTFVSESTVRFPATGTGCVTKTAHSNPFANIPWNLKGPNTDPWPWAKMDCGKVLINLIWI